MAYIIGIILVVIALIIVGLILRKRVYDVVDRLEGWKMDITNRNIAAELQRIKGLNLSGETQVKFESWKERWEHIAAKELPDIEEFLFDAEEAADKYRFSYAKKILRSAEKALQAIEKDIETMLLELDQLLDSEETSRIEAEHIEPEIKLLKKKLSQNRYQYGKAEARLDAAIDELVNKMNKYSALTESGDYFEAKQLVDELKNELAELTVRIDEFPSVYKAFKHDLPLQLDDLLAGIREMKSDGYRVEHLGFEKEASQYHNQVLEHMKVLDKGEMKDAKTFKSELDTRIKEMYQLLEKEAMAKNYVSAKIPEFKKGIETFTVNFEETKTEVESLKQAYYFEDDDLDKYISLDKSITLLKSQLDDFKRDMENEDIVHSSLRDSIEAGFAKIESVQKEYEIFKDRIHNLRKDEIKAKENLSEIKTQISSAMRRLNKSNVPGVPAFIWNAAETANEANVKVLKALDKQPLDISEVQQTLEHAHTEASALIEMTDTMLEQAYLTERVIQYANRYRSHYPALNVKLTEAERLFRKFEYELSLENAAKALEEVEPGALKRIEAYVEEVPV